MQAAGAGLVLPALPACVGADRVPVAGVPASGFDDDATAEQVTEGIELAGKTAVVTGCTTGIGFETMRVLAKRGALVVGTSRSLERARDACAKVPGTTMPAQLDLGDFDSVARCADVVSALQVPVDMLILNAGYRGGGNERHLINGIERHFAINHLGHFIFTNRLMSRLYAAWQGRIVVVASRSAYREAPGAGILFDDLAMERDYSDGLAYGQSKLANVLFALKLADLLRGTRITSNALHPGTINTEIDRNTSRMTQFLFGVYTGVAGKTLEQGAATSCYVATSSKLGNVSGRYFEDFEAVEVEGQGHMQDMVMAERLLEKSIELTADWLIPFEEPPGAG